MPRASRPETTAESAADSREELDRLPQTQRAYREIRRRILDNDMPPNAQYLEQELADALGMSRTPVREALIRLSDERLVEVRPRHGARVLPVSVDDMREIYELMTELEALAARIVAERGLMREELRELERIVADMNAALERDDLLGWARLDELFHTHLVELAGNSRMSQVVSTFRDQAYRARMQTLKLRPKPVESNRDHASLVEAIRNRDAEHAATIHRRHRQKAASMLLQLLARCGSEGL